MAASAVLQFCGNILPSDRRHKLPDTISVHVGVVVALGRDPKENDVLLRPPQGRYEFIVSRKHAQLEFSGDELELTDRGSVRSHQRLSRQSA